MAKKVLMFVAELFHVLDNERLSMIRRDVPHGETENSGKCTEEEP